MKPAEGPLTLRLRVIHGAGSVAFGVKDNGFSFFLLIFYNQVLGMDAGLVSLALLIALLVDALVDPLLGNLSDRTYTRWGRRLPWLYAAPIPLAIAWAMLWSAPAGEPPSFLGLLGVAIVVRLLLSACEVPSISLVPEITLDYDERTTLFRYRALAAWMGGLAMMILAYTVFMPGAEGLLEAEGYFGFGVFGAVLMAVSVIGSAVGQHRLEPEHLRAHRAVAQHLRPASVGGNEPADGRRTLAAERERKAHLRGFSSVMKVLEDHTGLAHDHACFSIKPADSVHPPKRQHDGSAACIRRRAACHAAIAALRHDRHAMHGAQLDQCGDFGSRGGRGEGEGAPGVAPSPVGQPGAHPIRIGRQPAWAEQLGSLGQERRC